MGAGVLISAAVGRRRATAAALFAREVHDGSRNCGTKGHRVRIEPRPRTGLRHGARPGGRIAGDQRAGPRIAGEERGGHQARDRRRRDAGGRRHLDRRRAGSRARGVPGARHFDQQQRRPAVSQFSGAGPSGDAGRRDHEHGDAHRAHPEGDRRHGGARLRKNRQHHLDQRQDAARRPGSVERCPSRTHRIRRGRRAQRRRQERDHQQSAAGQLRNDRLRGGICSRGEARRHGGIGDRARGRWRRFRRGASARPRSSARSARFYAACMPGTSPARTSCSTAEPTRRHSRMAPAGRRAGVPELYPRSRSPAR